ncbi:MAG TPA: hypothetical protein VGG06_16625, partial [Thermoanaerobaculia bacterium]|jgi:hypothetical protein
MVVDGVNDPPPRKGKAVDVVDDPPPRKGRAVDAVDEGPPGAATGSDDLDARPHAVRTPVGVVDVLAAFSPLSRGLRIETLVDGQQAQDGLPPELRGARTRRASD